ncbi:hypothetical protein BHE74_00029954 [Ensete ventricosum]|nr:hypothetical protein GW17_00011080 [Ensete ventricosum]RWW62896.1 hypothetical protein BHE74_00029954 [Ensete ventricosum]RZS07299.1 hypothetical protein BHM03_00038124 [Ensete ventricosum]
MTYLPWSQVITEVPLRATITTTSLLPTTARTTIAEASLPATIVATLVRHLLATTSVDRTLKVVVPYMHSRLVNFVRSHDDDVVSGLHIVASDCDDMTWGW